MISDLLTLIFGLHLLPLLLALPEALGVVLARVMWTVTT